MNWASKYIGLPFVNRGRDFSGVDCWGLVKLVMQTEKQVTLYDYGEISALDLAAIANIMKAASIADPWVSVHPHSVKPFDVVVMHRRHDAVHVGIMATDTEVLHIEEKINAVMVPLTHQTIRFRKPLFLRHRELLHDAAA